MSRLFDKANFNDEAKFGLLRSAMVQHLDLAQFAIYRDAKKHIRIYVEQCSTFGLVTVHFR